MINLNPYYNPDERQTLYHHKELLKIAEQDRLVRLAMKASQPVPVQAKTSLKELFSRLKGFKLSRKAPSSHPA